jgi:sugar/nucleoside kinase (ribokinase family)
MPAPVLKRLDVIGVGDTCVDIAVKVERIPRRDEKIRGRLVGKNPGGVVGNFCCAAAKFGARTGLVTVVGDDEFGRLCVEDYRSFRMDDRGIKIKPNGATYFCFVLLDSSGEKALTIVETPLLIPATDDIDISYLVEARYVHLSSLGFELVRYVVDQLKTTDVRVSIDLESTAAGAGLADWESILESTYILFCNQTGLAALLKDSDEAACVDRLLGLGVKVVVITKGSVGGTVATREETFFYPAFSVNVRDSTGAGDCFNGVFISCLAKGLGLAESACQAAAAAAISIQSVGARVGLPSSDQVKEFLSNCPEFVHFRQERHDVGGL